LKKNRNFLLTIIIGIIIFLIIFVLNRMTPIIADDYSYLFYYDRMERVETLKQVIDYQINHYFTWGGRSVVHFIAQLMLISGSHAKIINSLGFMAFVIIIYINCCGLKKSEPSLLAWIPLLIWLFNPVFGQTILWVTGSANYLWGSLIILSFLLPFTLYENNPSILKDNIFSAIIMFFAGVIAGWTNENTAAALIFLILCLIVYHGINKVGVPKWQIFGGIGTLVGFAIMILSPGNFVRAGYVSEDISTFKKIFDRAHLCAIRLYEMKGLVLIFFALIVVYFSFTEEKNKKVIVKAGLFFTSALAAVGAMLLSPSFPQRASFGAMSLMIVACGVLYANIKKLTPKGLIKNLEVLLLLFSIGVFSKQMFFDVWPDINNTNSIWNKRIEIINEKVESGEQKAILPTIDIWTTFNPMYDLSDLSQEDSSHWVNKAISLYFGLEEVLAE